MSKPVLEVAEVVRRFGGAFLNAYEASLSLVQKAVLRALCCVTPRLWAAISSSVTTPPAASCALPTTPVAIDTAPSASPWPRPAGSLPVNNKV
jgi:hypothetical protein